MPPERTGDGTSRARRLQVEVDADLRSREEGEGLVEKRRLPGQLRDRMGENESSAELDNVELDEVAAEPQRKRERGDRVLRGERSGAPSSDSQQLYKTVDTRE